MGEAPTQCLALRRALSLSPLPLPPRKLPLYLQGLGSEIALKSPDVQEKDQREDRQINAEKVNHFFIFLADEGGASVTSQVLTAPLPRMPRCRAYFVTRKWPPNTWHKLEELPL